MSLSQNLPSASLHIVISISRQMGPLLHTNPRAPCTFSCVPTYTPDASFYILRGALLQTIPSPTFYAISCSFIVAFTPKPPSRPTARLAISSTSTPTSLNPSIALLMYRHPMLDKTCEYLPLFGYPSIAFFEHLVVVAPATFADELLMCFSLRSAIGIQGYLYLSVTASYVAPSDGPSRCSNG